MNFEHLDFWVRQQKMILFIFTLLSAQVGCDDSIELKGYRGGSVIIIYKYDYLKYSNHTKYFCKMKEGDCKYIVSQTEKKQDLKGKFFALDEIQSGVYNVLIRNLSQEDGGTYKCGVTNQNDSQLNVKLEVKNGLYYGKSFSQTTYPGDTVTFSCTYPKEQKDHIKSVYRVASQYISAIIFTYTDYEKGDRYVLRVSKEDKVINMSINNMTVDDGGLYLCGVFNKESSYVSVFSEMQLQVIAPANIPPPGSLAISITMGVGVALLLIAGFVLIFYKLRSTKAKDASSPANRENRVNREGANSTYYEEIQDLQVTTLYSIVQKPRTHHSSPNPAGRSTTSPPNAAKQDVYSLVQLSKTEME
ncbi:polymeric immunoglobulin receptor-like isoform X2 [Neoarius graeffei]|uniref:polymeric immunoglobulin receptor-like isoform X2 n=1 Tax=Neoarius graeffei TaxID=443677 RepID=UPI00298D52D9|nr:polymeric immunoglobulin receptor-like isoform X2 [Neoarius graeffei]